MRGGQWLRVVQIIPLRIFRGPDMPMVGEMQRAIKFDGHKPRYANCQVDQKVVRGTAAGQVIVGRVVIQNE